MVILFPHDDRGRRTRRGNGPLKAGTGRRKPIPSGREQSNAYRQVERTNEAKNGVGEVQRLGNVAQWAERQTHNLRVSGSNPGIPTKGRMAERPIAAVKTVEG